MREDAAWRVAVAGRGLEDRRVEITGPTDPKMTVNAMNSGARVWLADQEDATSPTWDNVIGGQLSLMDALRRRIDFVASDGRTYALGETTPTIVMRPRSCTSKSPTFVSRIRTSQVPCRDRWWISGSISFTTPKS